MYESTLDSRDYISGALDGDISLEGYIGTRTSAPESTSTSRLTSTPASSTQSSTSTEIPTSVCPENADLNNDGLVNLIDIAAVIESWGPCVAFCRADIDCSGTVDLADIFIVILQWSSI